MKFSLQKGTKDILPDEIHRWQKAEKIFASVAEQYGFREIRIPTFEQTELFTRGVGDSTDVVRKEMYTFDDKGGRSITLRPEGTAGVVRSFIENGMSSLAGPVRLYYNITAFRYEKMQKGRFREFHQFGLEAFGSKGPQIDAEVISILVLFFERMGLSQTQLRINSIGCPTCRVTYHEKLKSYFSETVSGMCGDCKVRFEINPLRMLDCKEEYCHTLTAKAPRQIDFLCEECQSHFDGLKSSLDTLGIQYVVDSGIVRGLDYYTRTVFEFVSEHVGTQGTICGGGRYDKLIESMGGSSVPGIGFAMGVERFLLEADAQGIVIDKENAVQLYLANFSEETREYCQKLAYGLRRAGIGCETDVMGRSFRAQLKYAGKAEIPFMAVIGTDEINAGIIRLKRMSDGFESELSASDFTAEALQIIKNNSL